MSDGALNVVFTNVVNSAKVNAIEVAAADPPPATRSSHVYRGDGLRHSSTAGGATSVYTWDVNAGLPVVLQDGQRRYVYGHGLISQTDAGDFQEYVLTDGLGSTAALVGIDGSVQATYAYDAFGGLRSGWTDQTEYCFAGQHDDPATGLYYLRARFYDPATGRFLSKDPSRASRGCRPASTPTATR